MGAPFFQKQSKMSDRLFGIFVLAISAAMAAAAWQFDPPISYEPIGPSTYPLLLALLMAAFALRFIVKPDAEPDWPRGALLRKVAAMFVALFAYGLLFQPLGFVIATALLTIAVGRLFGGSWRHCAIGGPAMGLGLYVFFDRLLEVTLPVGGVWRAAGLG